MHILTVSRQPQVRLKTNVHTIADQEDQVNISAACLPKAAAPSAASNASSSIARGLVKDIRHNTR